MGLHGYYVRIKQFEIKHVWNISYWSFLGSLLFWNENVVLRVDITFLQKCFLDEFVYSFHDMIGTWVYFWRTSPEFYFADPREEQLPCTCCCSDLLVWYDNYDGNVGLNIRCVGVIGIGEMNDDNKRGDF